MAVKGASSPPPPVKAWTLCLGPFRQWRFGVLTAMAFLGMLVVWSIDGTSVRSFMEVWRITNRDYQTETTVTDSEDLKVFAKHKLKGNFKSVESDFSRENFTHPIQTAFSRENFTHPVQTDVSRENFTHPVQTEFSRENFTHPGQAEFSRENVTHPGQTEFSRENFTNPLPIPSIIAKFEPNATNLIASDFTHTEKIHPFLKSGGSPWVSAEFEPNLTTNLLAQWIFPGGEPCRDSKTSDVSIPGLDLPGASPVSLPAGEAHEFVFRALDGAGNPRCSGGDYFETDLSGENWKSRPLVKDFGNGSYSVSLQVHQNFHGTYNFTMILLYRHFEGLRFSPWRFTLDRGIRNLTIRFVRTGTQLPALKACEQSDFNSDIWAGRWTRHDRNDHCLIGDDGRYRCLDPSLACTEPWCAGPVGSLESNGWVYSAHCSFKIFRAVESWDCLKNRWIFFWGDSNHVDTIRNMLNFVLDLPDIVSVPRRFDRNFTNPRNASQSVRITSIFNGHWNESMNYQGFNSLRNDGFRRLLIRYFSEKTAPDTIILNSGLHDGVFWKNIRRYSDGAHYAASFWAEILDSVRMRGLAAPRVIYRTTVATGGYARSMAFNPMKMEMFNWVALEKFREAGVVSGVVDNFDMTFPWHFDNRCNDGVHYGRAPAKMKWRDGEIGHQYFVDLMLAHVLLNAICPKQ